VPPATLDQHASISGHVWLYKGKRRSTWCAKWRDQHGQHEKRLGPAWTGKGPPPPGFLREREAQALLDALIVDARRGQLRQRRTGVTFAGVAEDWFTRGCYERDWSASTRVDYRSVLDAHLLPEFAPKRIETITTEQIERWRSSLADEEIRSRRTVNKIVDQPTRHLRARRRAPRPERQSGWEGQAPARVRRRGALRLLLA
jgi:integrase